MARTLPKRDIYDLRGLNLLIPVLQLLIAHVALNGLINCPASGVPKDHPGRFFLGMKQVEFFSYLSVIALFRFGNPVEVGF